MCMVGTATKQNTMCTFVLQYVHSLLLLSPDNLLFYFLISNTI